MQIIKTIVNSLLGDEPLMVTVNMTNNIALMTFIMIMFTYLANVV